MTGNTLVLKFHHQERVIVILELANTFQIISFTHIFRENNQLADQLDKHAIELIVGIVIVDEGVVTSFTIL
jgi:hypothetical protein